MTYTARRLADMLDGEVSWLSVRTASAVPSPDWISCAELLKDQQAGGDPTYGWRKALLDDYGREYAIEPPLQVAAMFVLMWYVSVPSIVAGLSTALTGLSPDVSPESLAFRKHPTAHYPMEVALLSERLVPVGEAAQQVNEHTRAFTDSYSPGVKLSSRQKRGAVDDELRAAFRLPEEALQAAAAASVFQIDLDQEIRTSCCFFYALPNVNPCGGCPRVRV
ncbi:(2Fe-2S)-binding protein [Streptomyces sp. SID13031]|uniref:(2Fe-2S)-binding protein n=1 Tax=Streptomyces sp. SID13031 TaxID=2706046 RepID=UPI0013C898FF|nr:(2Fe-2S)-binding protein [Streptomyces sp. SID13031]NEA33782.1 (2Fe-2S)-binding protein [Streptomyces sp. SID13031]